MDRPVKPGDHIGKDLDFTRGQRTPMTRTSPTQRTVDRGLRRRQEIEPEDVIRFDHQGREYAIYRSPGDEYLRDRGHLHPRTCPSRRRAGARQHHRMPEAQSDASTIGRARQGRAGLRRPEDLQGQGRGRKGVRRDRLRPRGLRAAPSGGESGRAAPPARDGRARRSARCASRMSRPIDPAVRGRSRRPAGRSGSRWNRITAPSVDGAAPRREPSCGSPAICSDRSYWSDQNHGTMS